MLRSYSVKAAGAGREVDPPMEWPVFVDLFLTPVVAEGVVTRPYGFADRQVLEPGLLSGFTNGCLLDNYTWLKAAAHGVPALLSAYGIPRVDQQSSLVFVEH